MPTIPIYTSPVSGLMFSKTQGPNVSLLDIRPLTVDNFRPYGWLLGKNVRQGGNTPAFSNPDTDFWREHIFDPGADGETEILWVNYRNRRREVACLEVHRLCQQTIVPLTGELIQVVATSQKDGSPNLGSIRAFRVCVGEGICMRAGCWHATRVDAQEVNCLMLTRSSTTIDLVDHLYSGSLLSESAIEAIGGSLFLPPADALPHSENS
jgi:ureidoglycolate lyase